ncbi:MAG: helicase C-terminal domain-containing protein [Candidatus Tectimicrobiota bacterium]
MAIRFDPTTRTLWLSIGDLVESTGFPGSIALTPRLRTRAALGREVHTTRQAEQQAAVASYRSEVTIRQQLQVDDYTVHLQGRIDGLYEDGNTLIVEEIKSVLLPPEIFRAITPGHYTAYEQQLTLYVHLLRQQHSGPVCGHLVLVNLADEAAKTLVIEPPSGEDSQAFIVQQVRRILSRYAARTARAARRQSSLEALHFPFQQQRPHQEAMMEQVRLAIHDQSCVLLSAPTGIGKTVAALYPALEQVLRDGLRLFFVTAKTTQQTLAVETLQRLAQQGVQFTAVHLQAKEKSCLNDVYFCHENVCDYARDYAAKLERTGLVEALLELPVVGPGLCAEAGTRHRVCPFELSLDVATEADVIIGDYNYVFDPGSYLRRFFQDTAYNDCILIIDEAHNLYARGRDYYSPVLRQRRVRQLLSACADESARLFRDFETFFLALDALFPRLYAEAMTPPRVGEQTLVTPPWEMLAQLRGQLETLMADYIIYRRRTGLTPGGDPLQDFYYAWQRLCDVLALGGDEFAYLYTHHEEDAVFKVLCKDASRFLHERLNGFHSVVAMSATLSPFAFYQDVLGFPAERTFSVEFPSPFPASNRQVLVVPDISTAYRDRERDAPRTAQIIDTIVSQSEGNYGVFFPSFAYLRLVRTWLQYPPHRLIEQSATMSEADRAAVLERLRQRELGPALLLAVQGGIFAEGVDYPGDMLIGVIIVGPGLPRVDFEQEQIRAYYEDRYGQGFAYAYLYPGMNRVIQSAGRVIRSETDVGIIALLDKRFTYSNYNSLLPSHWYTNSPRELVTRNYQQTLRRFWDHHVR